MLKFIPLFVVVLIVYNIVIFAKPEWMLEPELFDANHSLTQEVIPAEEATPTPPPAADSPDAEEAAAPAAPEELSAEYISPSAKPIASINLPSGAKWKPIAPDILLLFAVLILFIELYKTTRFGSSAMAEHFLSFIVFLVFLAEFLLIRRCATSAFFLVMLLSLVDVIGGMAISRVVKKPAKA